MDSTYNPVLRIPQGRIEGFVLRSRKKKEYFGFYGIPYGTVPERFELPRKWEGWNGLRDGTNAKGMQSDRCIQISTFTHRFLGSESCHFLNVFAPMFKTLPREDVQHNPPFEPKQKYPVMVFIHGGGYAGGGGDLFGNKFLADEDVILVTFNYRLGALGFLNTGDGTVPGNLGLHDQIMALKWVQANIVFFGGDKDNVTLFGESAGAACVHFHMLSPLSTGLFSKAIMQSGTALCPWAFNHRPLEKTKKLLKQLDLNGGYHHTNMMEMVTKLKRLEAEALVAQRRDFQELKENAPIIHFAPSIDSCSDSAKAFLTDSPVQLLYKRGLVNDVPLILGINSKEGLYRSLAILRNKPKVTALNEHWSHELPIHLMYKKDDVASHDDFVKKIRKFYFDNKPIVFPDGVDARERLTNMISDRLFIYPTRKTALLHRSLKKNPANGRIYLYYFDYTGDYSFANGFEVKETYGASHADELQYLMNQRVFYSKIMPGSQADRIIDKMTSLWGKFALNGVPSYPRQTNEWMPMPSKDEVENDVIQYFKIGKEDKMIVEPFTERMEFWDRTQNLSLSF